MSIFILVIDTETLIFIIMRAEQDQFLAVTQHADLMPVFMEQLDAIYWQGYAERLQDTMPAQFNEEYEEFLTLYS